MNILTFKVKKEPGFRINLSDLIILIVLGIISYLIYRFTTEGYLFFLPLYIGFTFFLFCNVFRIGNRLEPFWYVPFVLCVIYGLYDLKNLWPVILWICEPLKIILILYRIKKGPYVGIFHRVGKGNIHSNL